MVCLFVAAMQQRNRLRAYWWAMRLARSDNLAQRAYYLASLTAVGDSAAGAIHRLAVDRRPEIRALAIPAMARLSEPTRLAELGELLSDQDAEVSESAALALAFTGGRAATSLLVDQAASTINQAAASSVAALARLSSPEALRAICDAARSHPDPFVRAQAVESLFVWLEAEWGTPRFESAVAQSGRDPIAGLVAAMQDQDQFTGVLSVERQIAAAESAATTPARTASSRGSNRVRFVGEAAAPADVAPRTVRQVAAKWIAVLTGRQFDPDAVQADARQAELAEQVRRGLDERHLGRDHLDPASGEFKSPDSSDTPSDAE